MGDFPIWCVLGHQLSNPSVNTRNAFSTPAFTVTVFKTGAIAVVVSVILFYLDFLPKRIQREPPKLLEVLAQCLKTLRMDLIHPPVAHSPVHHQASRFQNPQMLRNRRP